MTKKLFLLLLSIFLIGSLSVYGLGGGEEETAQTEGETEAAEGEAEVTETQPAEGEAEVAEGEVETPETVQPDSGPAATGVAGAATFSDWDTDMDSNLSEEELAQGFDQWTTDQQDSLGAEDIQMAPISQEEFDAWDTSADGQLSRDEFTQGVLQDYDMDGDMMLSEEEASGLFGAGS